MAFLIALSLQLFCQLFKCIVYSVRDKKINFRYLFMSGGLISAHSAFVSTLVMYLVLTEGVSSPWFSVSAVFSIIVIHDAFRLRGEVQKHAEFLNKLLNKLSMDRSDSFPQLSENLGHSGMEVFAGIFLGAGYAFIIWLLIGAIGPGTA